MRCSAWLALLVASSVPLAAQGLFGPAMTPVSLFSQIGSGPQRDGSTAAGAKVSLNGTGVGNASITCPYTGATYRVSAGGAFSTFTSPGNVTPEVAIGSMSTSVVISNLLVSANEASWRGSVKVVCGTVGVSGSIYVPEGIINYATGTLAEGSAALNKGTALTGDTSGTMAVVLSVTMAGQSSANKFRLDGMTIERLY